MRITYVFLFVAILFIIIQLVVFDVTKINGEHPNKGLVMYIYDITCIVIFFSLVGAEIKLERVLRKHFRVQYEHHKWVFRKNLTYISISLCLQLFFNYSLMKY